MHRWIFIAGVVLCGLTAFSSIESYAQDLARPAAVESSQLRNTGRYFQSMNPDISVVLDTYYHNDDSKEGIAHVLEEMAGFGHTHGDDGHDHAHGPEDGFNLKHAELILSASVDPYFKALANVAVSEESVELEEAIIETTCLPGGLGLRIGKFFSDFSRINSQHSHQWEFSDAPLIHKLTLGDHGLNDTGVQLSWLAPAPFYLLAGVEAFQGDNEVSFAYDGDDPLPNKGGPRVFTTWLKVGPNLPGPHGLELRSAFLSGVHQEIHDGNEDGVNDHWLHGHSTFWSLDAVYKYDSPRAYGEDDWIVQAQYLNRLRDIEVEQHDLNAALVGRDREDKQDGFYLQAVYGFAPRWRTGLRWDVVGLTNEVDTPPGASEDYDASQKVSAMVDFTPSEFSRIRLQVANGSYETEDGDEEVFQVCLQVMISLGTHGAHKF